MSMSELRGVEECIHSVEKPLRLRADVALVNLPRCNVTSTHGLVVAVDGVVVVNRVVVVLVVVVVVDGVVVVAEDVVVEDMVVVVLMRDCALQYARVLVRCSLQW
jgi:hypothetical protein